MKTIKLDRRSRDKSKIAYRLDVATDHPERLPIRLEAFECTVRDIEPLDEANHRLILSVTETPHVSAGHRLDAALGVLADVAGVIELGRIRLDEADVRAVQFQLDVEARFPEYGVRRILELATGVRVIEYRDLPGGNFACTKCNSENLRDTNIVNQRDGGVLVRCQSCGFVGGPVRRPRRRILTKVIETPGITGEERLEVPLQVIRSTARHFALVDMKRIDPDGQGEGVPSPVDTPSDSDLVGVE